MKKNIFNSYFFIRQALFDDLLDRRLFIFSLILFFLDFYLWKSFLSTDSLYIFLRINIYPIKFLAIVMGLNTVLAVSAYDKEKEVGYLLLIGNIILGILIFALEIFYITHL